MMNMITATTRLVEGLCSLDHPVLGLIMWDGEGQLDLGGAYPVRQWQSKYDELLRAMRELHPTYPELSRVTLEEAWELTGVGPIIE
jgi:hypothetical protein